MVATAISAAAKNLNIVFFLFLRILSLLACTITACVPENRARTRFPSPRGLSRFRRSRTRARPTQPALLAGAP